MNPDRGGSDELYDNDSAPYDVAAGGFEHRTEGQVPQVRPAAPEPSPRGRTREEDSSEGGNDAWLAGGDHGRGRGDGARAAGAVSEDSWVKENLPPVDAHEIEFIVPDALSYQMGQNTRSVSKTVGNFRFRILVFPSGTHTTGGQQVSAFVEADPFPHLDPRWVFNSVKYQVTVVNWLDYRKSVTKHDNWSFSREGIDRGWHDMVRTADLTPELGWLNSNNELCVRASCQVKMADGISINSDYNFRRETGFIGLMNHGATCYMNGLLQSLFHLGEFRRIVYSIDCDESPDSPGKDDAAGEPSRADADGDGKSPSLISALQNVFYRLHTSDQAVNCRELMKSFGWDTVDAFTQHDAQELNRILCDRLEEQMKGTPMDGSIKRLFEGEMENYIECIDVDYKSRRNETFYDIQLNIKSERGIELRSIEESLREFTAEEILEGDNAYEAEGHGKQRAKKGIRFLTFPPVLNLQLKRFHFDLEKMDMVKLNTKFEFHKKLDLSSFAPGAGTYILHAVVVHSGDVNSGHYYAFIKPDLTGQKGWFKFDDDTVTPCSEYAAVEDNYGGSDLSTWMYFDRSPAELRQAVCPVRPRIQNAYMLVYIKEDLAGQILQVPDPSEVNARLVERCDREARLADQRRKEKLEQQTKIKIRLVFEKDLAKMTGFWEHTDVAYGHTLKMSRDQLVKDLAAEVETITEVPRAHMAIFSLHHRNTPRQVRFAHMEPKASLRNSIPTFSAPHFDPSDPYLTVLVCFSKGYTMDAHRWKPAKESDKPDQLVTWREEQHVLLIVKYFCPVNHKLVTLGCTYISTADPLLVMVSEGWLGERLKPYLNSKDVAPLPDDPDSFSWECWEELSERNFQRRLVKRAVNQEQLWSGDVIIWQPSSAGRKEGEADPEGATIAPDGLVEPPVYSMANVQDYAKMLESAVDVVVTLHDFRQPLCVDGVISNGVWGLPRPQSGAQKEAAAQKDERPEDAALALSPATFDPPREQELKMDLRWNMQIVTSSIVRKFGLKAPEAAPGAAPGEAPQLWLFHAAPASTCEDPLNSAQPPRNEQTTPTTLKDLHLQRTLAPAGKKSLSLSLHAVELPPAVSQQAADRCPLCIRFFDDSVREVGCTVVTVSETSTMKEVLAEAAQHLRPEWGIAPPLRALEVADGRLHKLWRPEMPVRSREHASESLACFNKANILYHCLRVEADGDAVRAAAQGHRMIEIFHSDRQSQQAFAQPILIPVAAGEKSGSLKNRCKDKLRVPEQEFRSWRLVRCSSRAGRTHLKDDEPFDQDASGDARYCLEHVHPNPTSSFARQSRYNKPLTIK